MLVLLFIILSIFCYLPISFNSLSWRVLCVSIHGLGLFCFNVVSLPK